MSPFNILILIFLQLLRNVFFYGEKFNLNPLNYIDILVFLNFVLEKESSFV